MRLRTQFAVLTTLVTLVPVVFGLFLFGAQQSPRDPRVPTRDFLSILGSRLEKGATLGMDDLQEAAELSGMPLREAALVTKDGDILASSFANYPAGSRLSLIDLARPLRGSPDQPRPEVRLMPLDMGNPDSPLVLMDIQPFWTRQDIRNRNLLTIGLFALGLFAVSGILSFIILRSISRAIKTIEADTAIVATGNLDHTVSGSGNHEILSLASSINMMRLNLKDMLARRSRMLMGIGHDLKTPIALIQGYADALADGVAVDADTRMKYVEIIRSKSRQLEDLAAELVDFLKIGGDGAYSVVATDPSALLSSLGARFESDAGLMKRKFRWGFGDRMGQAPEFPVGLVTMNRALAERAIENLVTNAFKYSGQAAEISLRLVNPPEGLAFSVTDEGPGIADQDQPYVFDAFYRGSPSRSDGGHGLGLTIVKAVAELHGWKVKIGPRRDGRQGTEALLVIRPGPKAGDRPGAIVSDGPRQ